MAKPNVYGKDPSGKQTSPGTDSMDYWLWHEKEAGTTGAGLKAPPSWYSESAAMGDGTGTFSGRDSPGKMYVPWSSDAADEDMRDTLGAQNTAIENKEIPLQLDQIDTLFKNGSITEAQAEGLISDLSDKYAPLGEDFFESELKNYVIEAYVGATDTWNNPSAQHLHDETVGSTEAEKLFSFLADVDEFEALPEDVKGTHKDLYGVEAGEAIPDDTTFIPSSAGYSPNASDKERAQFFITAHQCFLLHNLEALADFHRGAYHNSIGAIHYAAPGAAAAQQPGVDSPYLMNDGQHRFLLVDDTNPDQAFAVANKLTCLGRLDDFTSIKPDEAAHLVPRMRLFKTKGVGVEQKKVEMEFDGAVDDKVFKNSQILFTTGRPYPKGTGCGIKSFSWSYLGGDPFMATKDLRATLKIYFQDFRDLVELRSGDDVYDPTGEQVDYRYVDLVLQGDCRDSGKAPASNTSAAPSVQMESSEYYYPECYEIAVELGYADVDWAGKVNSKIKDLIKKQTTTIYLIAVEHTFDINQDGTFELTIEYRGRLGEKLGSKGANILIAGGGAAKLTGIADIDVPEVGKLHWDLHVLEELRKEEERQVDSDTGSY